jgi:RimJ/RimL family protein N-acetyltransferase
MKLQQDMQESAAASGQGIVAAALDPERSGSDKVNDPVRSAWVNIDQAFDLPSGLAQRAGWPNVATARSQADRSGLTFREWRIDDLPAFRALLDDPQVWTHMPTPYPGPITTEMARDLIELSNSARHHLVRAVLMGDRPIGQVRLEFSATGTEVSYWLGRPYWGQGLGRRMVVGFLDQQAAGDRVFARVHRGNPASLRLLTGIGFVPQDDGAGDWITLTRQGVSRA